MVITARCVPFRSSIGSGGARRRCKSATLFESSVSIAKRARRWWRAALALLPAVQAFDLPVAIAQESATAGVTTEVSADKSASHKKGHRKKKRKHPRSAAANAPTVERPSEPSVSNTPSSLSGLPTSAIGVRETSAPDG